MNERTKNLVTGLLGGGFFVAGIGVILVEIAMNSVCR